MPKMKTCKSVAKRFRVTPSGKLLRRKQGKSHLLSCKNAKRRMNLRKNAEVVSKPFAQKISRLIV